MRSNSAIALLLTLTVLRADVRAQVPVGHALVASATATVSPSLWLFEPLGPSLTPLDVTALPNPFRVSALHVVADGARILLAGEMPIAPDDALFTTTLTGQALTALRPFAQGIRGRVVSMFTVAATAEVVVVTGSAVFAVAATGGAARMLTPVNTDMGNLTAAFLPPSTVISTAVDTLGQTSLWRLDLATQQVGRLPLRLTGRTAVAPGPRPDSVLLGESTGQVWVVDLSSLARSAWVHVGRSPLRGLWDYGDRQAWFAAVGSDIQRIGQQILGPTLPVPGGVVQDISYRAYESDVTRYGAACPGFGSRLADIGWQGRPVPGNDTFTLTVGNARASTPVAMMIGATATNIPLDGFGMPSCILLTQPLVSIPASTTGTGFAQVPLAIPPDPGLARVRLFVQWLVIDVGANSASLVVSNGARVQI